MKTLVAFSFVGMNLVLWPLVRGITRLEVFRTLEHEHQKYYERLNAQGGTLQGSVGATCHQVLSYPDALCFAEMSDYVIMGEAWRKLESSRILYYNCAGIGLLMLGISALMLARRERASARPRPSASAQMG